MALGLWVGVHGTPAGYHQLPWNACSENSAGDFARLSCFTTCGHSSRYYPTRFAFILNEEYNINFSNAITLRKA